MKVMLYELLTLNPSILSFALLIFCTHYCSYALHCLPFRMPERQGAIEMSEAPPKRTGPLPPPPSQTRKTTLYSLTIVHTITGATKTKKKKKTRISTQTTHQGPRNL